MMTDRLRRPEPQQYRVLATSEGFEPGFRGGGPIRSLAHIVDTLSEATDLCLITRDRDLGAAKPYPGRSGRWMGRGRSQVFYLNVRRPLQWFRLWHQLHAIPFDLLYVNSLWSPVFTVGPVLAVRLNLLQTTKILIAPRGELSPGALSLKARRKLLFLRWWAHLLRMADVVWHASSETEAAEIRTVFPLAQIRVNRPQVSLPVEPIEPTKVNEGPTRFVFIGRISPMKNLDLTLIALRNVSEPVQFDIYGPLEDASYWSKCQSLIGRLPAHIQVTYLGELLSSDVRRTFSRYDAFVVPTLGENFGHAIAESLSASCPVLCSDQTPWTEVLEGGGGIVVRHLTPEGLSKELQRFASLTAADRHEARQAAGRAYRLWRHNMAGPNILEEARLMDRP